MATDKEFIEFACEQIRNAGEVTYKKMFGEYMAYVNGKPILLVCDNTVSRRRGNGYSVQGGERSLYS